MRCLHLIFIITAFSISAAAQSSFSVKTNKNIYTFSDIIVVTITATNNGSLSDTLRFPTSAQAGYTIDSLNSRIHDSTSCLVLNYFTERIIPPHDSTRWEGEADLCKFFKGADVHSGRHYLIARVDCMPSGWVSDTLWIEVDGPLTVTPERMISDQIVLENNFPNPFNPTTTIRFSLPRLSRVSLKVFNLLGKEVAFPFDGILEPGAHNVEWDASGHASGVYFYQLQAGSFTTTRKLLLVR